MAKDTPYNDPHDPRKVTSGNQGMVKGYLVAVRYLCSLVHCAVLHDPVTDTMHVAKVFIACISSLSSGISSQLESMLVLPAQRAG